ncbi:hypothetical protein WH47_02011, partial [Habropoda laboriosa]
ICVESMTTGTVIPCFVPCLLITARTYSTLGKTRLLSGVMTRYSQPLMLYNKIYKILIKIIHRTFRSPYRLDHVQFHHEDDSGDDDSRKGSVRNKVQIRVVFTPDEWFTAPRLRPPLTGMEETKAETTLQAPKANISCVASIGLPSSEIIPYPIILIYRSHLLNNEHIPFFIFVFFEF